MSERQLHIDVAKHLRRALPPDSWFTTFPSGGGGRIRGAHLKSMGLKPGVPDIMILHHGCAYWIELKAPGEYLEPHQRACHDDIERAGHHRPLVCRSLDDVYRALGLFGIATRARLAA